VPRVREECSDWAWFEKATAMQVAGIWSSLRLWLALDPRARNGDVIWVAGEVLNCICPNLPFVAVSDAVIGHKAGVGKVEVPGRGSKEVDVGSGRKVSCKRK
jgi:hypothetical protein